MIRPGDVFEIVVEEAPADTTETVPLGGFWDELNE